jgi:hypothetical protein
LDPASYSAAQTISAEVPSRVRPPVAADRLAEDRLDETRRIAFGRSEDDAAPFHECERLRDVIVSVLAAFRSCASWYDALTAAAIRALLAVKLQYVVTVHSD